MGPLAQRLSLDVFHHHSFQGGRQLEDAFATQVSTPLHWLGPEPFLVPIGKFPHIFPQEPTEHPCSEPPCQPGLPTSSPTSFTPPRSVPLVQPSSMALVPASESRRYASLILEVRGRAHHRGGVQSGPEVSPAEEVVQLTVGKGWVTAASLTMGRKWEQRRYRQSSVQSSRLRTVTWQ